MNDTTVKNFTLGDMARRVVIYENRGTTDAQQDGFRFRAQVLPDMTQSEDGFFEVAIYPEAYWTPLNVSNFYILYLPSYACKAVCLH